MILLKLNPCIEVLRSFLWSAPWATLRWFALKVWEWC